MKLDTRSEVLRLTVHHSTSWWRLTMIIHNLSAVCIGKVNHLRVRLSRTLYRVPSWEIIPLSIAPLIYIYNVVSNNKTFHMPLVISIRVGIGGFHSSGLLLLTTICWAACNFVSEFWRGNKFLNQSSTVTWCHTWYSCYLTTVTEC